MKLPSLATAFLALLCAISVTSAPALRAAEDSGPAPLKDIRVAIKTEKGDIIARLHPDRAPVTCASFLNLASIKFFNGLLFHRVVPGFVIQGGDPKTRKTSLQAEWGTGDPGYKFENEIDLSLRHNAAGILSMANSGPGTNGSQFFITLAPTPHLDGKHSVFGEVTEGMETVKSITAGDKILTIEILDSPEALFKAQSVRIREWNASLEQAGLKK